MHWTVAAWAMVAQVEHEATVEDDEYVPPTQGVHVVAPALVPVFVMEPGPHNVQESSLMFP